MEFNKFMSLGHNKTTSASENFEENSNSGNKK